MRAIFFVALKCLEYLIIHCHQLPCLINIEHLVNAQYVFVFNGYFIPTIAFYPLVFVYEIWFLNLFLQSLVDLFLISVCLELCTDIVNFGYQQSYSNSIPSELSAASIQSLKARDSAAYLASQSISSRYCASTSSMKNPTMSMSEV